MAHTLIATDTLDACIRICAPPPLAHTQFCIGICTPQHIAQYVEGGEGGKWSHTNTAQTPPEGWAITPTPFAFYGVGARANLPAGPKFREGISFLFARVALFWRCI